MNDQMQPFEENLSAIMDGELTGEELLESIDALVEDGELREFWRDSRSLQKALARPQSELVETPPSSVWENVEFSAGKPKRKAKILSIREVSPQVWAAAASIVLIFSLTLAGLFNGVMPEQANARTIQLGQNEGRMTEDRFLELTSELLKADPRYHRKMLEVMQMVNRDVYGITGDVRSDEGAPRSEHRDSEQNQQRAGSVPPDLRDANQRQEIEEPRRTTDNGDDAPVRFNLW
ncbi:hypothetical protein KQI52_06500 [bacterium]|nr:hypothetical protein [bacterium]